MMSMIKGLFKFVMYGTLGIVVLIVGLVIIGSMAGSGDKAKQLAKVETIEVPPVAVEEIHVKPSKEKIVKAKAPVLTLDDKIRNVQGVMVNGCKQAFKGTTLYPTKVDWDWGIDSKYWKNFQAQNNHRYLINMSGELMNGFGNMVPFTVTCKADWNSATNKTSLVEMYHNKKLIFAN